MLSRRRLLLRRLRMTRRRMLRRGVHLLLRLWRRGMTGGGRARVGVCRRRGLLRRRELTRVRRLAAAIHAGVGACADSRAPGSAGARPAPAARLVRRLAGLVGLWWLLLRRHLLLWLWLLLRVLWVLGWGLLGLGWWVEHVGDVAIVG
jgi:hypothetical protein